MQRFGMWRICTDWVQLCCGLCDSSTLQPALIQTLGQSREAQALFNLTNATLSYLQSAAWPLRPFFWAWSELRVVVRSPKVDQLSFTFAR